MDLKSNEPFWLVKNGILHSYPSLHGAISCEVLVVGGGITGSLIAHQCVADGYQTILIDRREVANGSTSATTSMLQYEIDVPLHKLMDQIGEKGALESYKACSDAIDTIQQLANKIGSNAGFRKKNSLYYTSKKMDVAMLQKELEARKQAGYRVTWMSPDELKEQYGLYHTYGGILSQQGGSIDAFMMAHELLSYNVKKGLTIFDKTELSAVDYRSGYNECHTGTGGVIKAKKIVYCIGFDSAHLIKEKFVDLISSFAIVSEVDKEQYDRYKDVLIWNTDDPYLYMRTTDDGRFLIGGEDVPFRNPVRRDALIGRKEKKLTRSMLKLFPDITFYPDFAWAGTFGNTKDGLPYIGQHKDFKNSYFVLGFGGNGITFSVAGMDMVSAWLKGKSHALTPYFKFGR